MTSGQWVFLRPIDRVYFGSPRVLTAGEVHGGRSEFPPSPYTVAGMLRTHLLEAADPPLNLDDWSRAERERRANLVGTSNRLPTGWQLLGPFPAREIASQQHKLEPWFPLPAWVKYGNDGRLHPHQFLQVRGAELAIDDTTQSFAPMADDDLNLDSNSWWLGTPRVPPQEGAPTWVPASVLKRLLSESEPVPTGGVGSEGTKESNRWFALWPADSSRNTPPFVRYEAAPGVAIESKRGTAIDSMLYTLRMLRFAPGSGLLVLMEGEIRKPLQSAALGQGVGRAGRKGQAAAFESAEGRIDSSWRALLDVEHLNPTKDHTFFWIYLATPARMRDPYSDVLKMLRQQALPGLSVSLVAVATGDPQTIGGLAVDGGCPRDNARYARAGSGWLVRLDGGTPEQRSSLLRAFHGRPTLGLEAERTFGFGLTLVGCGPRGSHAGMQINNRKSSEERSYP